MKVITDIEFARDWSMRSPWDVSRSQPRQVTLTVPLNSVNLALQFHRDFLPPLLPMMAEQFLDLLGDRHPITFDDFEASTVQVVIHTG